MSSTDIVVVVVVVVASSPDPSAVTEGTEGFPTGEETVFDWNV